MTIEQDAANATVKEYGSQELEVLPARRPLQEQALGALLQQSEAVELAQRMGEIYSQSELVGPAYRGKPANAAVAILYGAELGLGPLQSLQQVFVVHGMPAIYARTAVALCKRAGIKVETTESSDERVTVRVSDPHSGVTEVCTWDLQRATKAGYTSNKKYQTDPQAMLYAKAAMEGCRKVAPDILLGIPMSREEADLEAMPTRVRAERGGTGVAGLASMIGAPAPEAAPEPEYAEEVAAPVEPTPEQPEVAMATPAQLRTLAQQRKREGYNDDDEGRTGWFAWLTAAVNRRDAADGFVFGSNKELTESEAGEVIAMLAQAQTGEAK